MSIQELKNNLAEIKRDYAVLFGDVFWRYEYRADYYSHSFTHVYCRICNEVMLREDKQIVDCVIHLHPLTNLERYESRF